jgi:hypothetical protein
VNPAAWDPEFLDWDYIGAKWFWAEAGKRVGNGGFSLRSYKLLEQPMDSAKRERLLGAYNEFLAAVTQGADNVEALGDKLSDVYGECK